MDASYPDRLQELIQALALQWPRFVGNAAPKLVIGAESARAAGLRYASCLAPGITRHRRGKGFDFRDL